MDGVAEWLIPRVEFSFGGQRWQLVFTHRCLLLCERLTGIDMLAVDMSEPPARLMRALLFCALTGAGAQSTLEDAGEAIANLGMIPSRAVVQEAWIASMPDVEPPPKEAVKVAKYTWLEAWASATSRDGLGLTDERWLDMTPRQVRALQKMRLEQMQREELLLGIINSHIVNFSFAGVKKPAKAADFMLHKLPESDRGIDVDHIMSQLEKMGAKREG